MEEKKEAGSLIVAGSVKWRRKGHFDSVDPKLQFGVLLAVEAGAGACLQVQLPVDNSWHGQALMDWCIRERPNQHFRVRIFVWYERHTNGKTKGYLI